VTAAAWFAIALGAAVAFLAALAAVTKTPGPPSPTLAARAARAGWHLLRAVPRLPGPPPREMGGLTAWDPAELRRWTVEVHHTNDTPPWGPAASPAGAQDGGQPPAAGMVPGHGQGSPAAGDPVTHDLWQPRPAPPLTPPPAPGDAIAGLTGAAGQVRNLTLDEYEAALPGWEHATSWFAAITSGEDEGAA
jgi:hypothetical protein